MENRTGQDARRIFTRLPPAAGRQDGYCGPISGVGRFALRTQVLGNALDDLIATDWLGEELIASNLLLRLGLLL